MPKYENCLLLVICIAGLEACTGSWALHRGSTALAVNSTENAADDIHSDCYTLPVAEQVRP